MTPFEQVVHIGLTIKELKDAIKRLGAEIERREDEITRIHKVANDIQKEHPELWSQSPRGMKYVVVGYEYPDDLDGQPMILREGKGL